MTISVPSTIALNIFTFNPRLEKQNTVFIYMYYDKMLFSLSKILSKILSHILCDMKLEQNTEITMLNTLSFDM